jgi:diguanylate cyclase (GGDEF)-like protein
MTSDVVSPEPVLRLVRWLAIAWALLQFVLYEPPSGYEIPFAHGAGLLVLVPLAAVNLVSHARGEELATQRPRQWAAVQSLADIGGTLALVWLFGFDQASMLWALMVLPILAGALYRQLPGAVGAWTVIAVGYALCELSAARRFPDVVLDPASLGMRLGLLAILAVGFGALADRLHARAAEGEALRRVAHASRRLTTLDEREVLRETVAAAEAAGFEQVSVVTPGSDDARNGWQSTALALGTSRGSVSVPASELAGYCPGKDLEVAVAPLAAAEGTPLAVLVAGARRPVPAPAREALQLLASHAGVALHNAHLHRRTQQFEETLAHQALHDDLTGLANRRLLREDAGHALARSGREATRVAVLLIDLDGFKEINDTLGHGVGDRLLQQVGERLADTVRGADSVARLGGDEFAVLAVGLQPVDEPDHLAARLQQALHLPFHVEGLTLDVEASIGVAVAPEHGKDIDTLLRCADVAMYAAKADRAGVAVYAPRFDEHTPQRLAMLGELRRALEGQEQLVLHYQPKVSLDEDGLVGVEALLRWHHPTRGLVAPGDFLPTAEGAGLIHDLTRYVLAAALRQSAVWQGQGQPIPVSVNVSTRCLLDLSLPDRVAELLSLHGVPADLLVLEITETTIMADPGRALTVLQRLSEQGIHISIDDFGTGYSSMSYLRRLPVDEIKIDRTFVSDLAGHEYDPALVRTMVDLGHSLGLNVVAEGVEDTQTLTRLSALGCDVAQGYLTGRPMPAEQLTSLLRGPRSRQRAGRGLGAGRVPGPGPARQ